MNQKRKHSELDDLIDACLDNQLSIEEAGKLSQWIEESSEARQRYWDLASVHGMIEQSMQKASLKAVIGEEFTKPERFSRWPRITEIAAGILIGILSASLLWAYKTPTREKPPREKIELLYESFEDSSIKYAARFPKEASVWQGDLTIVKPVDGIKPLRGHYVARMEPAHGRKFSYVRQILDLSTLPPLEAGKQHEIEVQASFLSTRMEPPSQYQIRLAVFSEAPEEVRPIWNDESVLFDRVLRHVGKNHLTDSSKEGWQKIRASIEIPPNARSVVVSLAVADVGRHDDGSEHYLDAIRFRLSETSSLVE